MQREGGRPSHGRRSEVAKEGERPAGDAKWKTSVSGRDARERRSASCTRLGSASNNARESHGSRSADVRLATERYLEYPFHGFCECVRRRWNRDQTNELQIAFFLRLILSRFRIRTRGCNVRCFLRLTKVEFHETNEKTIRPRRLSTSTYQSHRRYRNLQDTVYKGEKKFAQSMMGSWFHGSVSRDTKAYAAIHQAWPVKRPGTLIGALQGQLMHLKRTKPVTETRGSLPRKKARSRSHKSRSNRMIAMLLADYARVLSVVARREQMTRLRTRGYLVAIVRKCQQNFYSGMIGRIVVFVWCDSSMSIRI